MIHIERHPDRQFSNALEQCMRKLNFRKLGLMDSSVWDVTSNITKAIGYQEGLVPVELEPWRNLYKELVSTSSVGDDHFAIANQSRHKRARGHGSEFFTPALYADHLSFQTAKMLSFMAKQLPKDERLIVVEPSCGTGAILMRFIRAAYLTCPELLPRIDYVANDINASSVQAVELNFEIQKEIGVPLGSLTTIQGDALDLLGDYQGKAHLVIGNPPFHAIDTSYLQPDSQLPCYYKKSVQFAHDNGMLKPDSLTKASNNTAGKHAYRSKLPLDVAIAEMSYRLLKPFGVTAMIIPDGILSNSKHQEFRQCLLDGQDGDAPINLMSVQSFPGEIFKHSDTTVKTSILMGSKNLVLDGVMMAMFEKVGWDSRMKLLTEDDITAGHVNDFIEQMTESYSNAVRRALSNANLLKSSQVIDLVHYKTTSTLLKPVDLYQDEPTNTASVHAMGN